MNPNKRYTYHSNNLCLHLTDTGKHIRMDGVRNTKLTESIRLELQQILTTVIHSTTDPAVFPACMLQL